MNEEGLNKRSAPEAEGFVNGARRVAGTGDTNSLNDTAALELQHTEASKGEQGRTWSRMRVGQKVSGSFSSLGLMQRI